MRTPRQALNQAEVLLFEAVQGLDLTEEEKDDAAMAFNILRNLQGAKLHRTWLANALAESNTGQRLVCKNQLGQALKPA